MAKAFRAVLWITVVGIALAAQGCWDDKPELTLLGEGGCRAADGSEGEARVVGASSPDECQAQCFVGQESCVAVEYNANNNMCEIHSVPITHVEKVEGVTCYVVK
jgi:PAN domain